jgi:hypothetical protein
MERLASMLAAVALLVSADTTGALRPPAPAPLVDPPSAQGSPETQGAKQNSDSHGAGPSSPGAAAEHSKKPQPGPLQNESRLTLVRYVHGEIVRIVKSIPAGKKGFHLKAGAPLDEKALRMALASSGAAINPGDRAQITNLEFKDKQIIVDINGGGKGRTHLRDHIHLEVGGAIPAISTTTAQPQATVNVGATLILDFDKPLPDMTPEQLEKDLSSLIDFSKRHSAAVQWVETLPPEIQKAIEEKHPIVGMDHEMVLAAMGRPDRKVREKGADGQEIEDWIYGKPPEKTIFVSFEGDKVKEVHQYPQ